MSVWKRMECNAVFKQHMLNYYKQKELENLRVYLAQWIEKELLLADNRQSCGLSFSQISQKFYVDLQQMLLQVCHENVLLEINMQIKQISAEELFDFMRNGLQQEIQLLEQMPVDNNNVDNGSGPEIQIAARMGIDKLVSESKVIRNVFQSFVTDYDTLNRYVREFNQKMNAMDQQVVANNKVCIQKQCNIMVERKHALFHGIRNLDAEFDRVQERVISEINAFKSWQRRQVLVGEGVKFGGNLDYIQFCVQLLVEILCEIRNYINIILNKDPNDNAILNEIVEHLRKAQEVLLSSSFIIEKQPPQILKKLTKFEVTIRWMIGAPLGANFDRSPVTCIILSEEEAKRFSAKHVTVNKLIDKPLSAGQMSVNESKMEYQPNTNVLSANFSSMHLNKIKRSDRKGSECVLEEKFVMLFFTTVVVNDYSLFVWTLSLPIVVIVHGNQVPQALATIIWDNAFSDSVREPFKVPKKVSWHQLSSALNVKFTAETERGLTPANLDYISEKLCFTKEYVTYAQFCKDPMPNYGFTFWEWFYAIMKLTKDHLTDLWKAGLIIGFISRQKTEELLVARDQVGMFLLRFPDSVMGSISASVYSYRQIETIDKKIIITDEKIVSNVEPYLKKDLLHECLAKKIETVRELQFLYPTGCSKDWAFGEFYSNQSQNQTHPGYVKPKIIRAVQSNGESIVLSHCQSPPKHEVNIYLTENANQLDAMDSSPNECASLWENPQPPAQENINVTLNGVGCFLDQCQIRIQENMDLCSNEEARILNSSQLVALPTMEIPGGDTNFSNNNRSQVEEGANAPTKDCIDKFTRWHDEFQNPYLDPWSTDMNGGGD